MKKSLLILAIIITAMIFSVCGVLIKKNNTLEQVKKKNSEYELYSGKALLGTDITTIMNKAIDQNEKNKIPKDEKGYYIENDTNSIKIDIEMITIEKTYPMEAFFKKGMTSFVENFNLIEFKCTSIEYHKKTGLISKIKFKQLDY